VPISETPRVLLSGFADEAANQKTVVQQFAAFAALGLQYYSIRFIDIGSGVKNVTQLTVSEIQKVRHLENEYGLNVSSIGSPIGKIKLSDVEDGTKNAYVPFKKYLENDVKKACDIAPIPRIFCRRPCSSSAKSPKPATARTSRSAWKSRPPRSAAQAISWPRFIGRSITPAWN
jgi:hypothetical protein